MSELKDAGMMLRLLHHAKLQLGIDPLEVYAYTGTTVDSLSDKHLRTPHDTTIVYWSAVAEISGDNNIGLHLGEATPNFQGQVIEYLFLSSSTFGEGLKRALHYQRLLSDAAKGELGTDSNGTFLSFDTVDEEPNKLRHLYEWLVCMLSNFFKETTGDEFLPVKIHFKHGKPADISEHKRILKCELEFDCPSARIYFDPSVLDLPSRHAEPELFKLHDELAGKHLTHLEKLDIVIRVRSAIGEVLEMGTADLETIAGKLSMTPRELRSRLNEVGTNFNQTLADFRQELAKRLLATTNETIDEIVYLTGFSEPSTFYRAFKRWVNMTPVEYREMRQREIREAKAAGRTAPLP
ncbi:MAG: AraC-like DNA-binding protein [Pseudoalteromonas tetraodonis]|jgi:AraC-like DNA-binding protein